MIFRLRLDQLVTQDPPESGDFPCYLAGAITDQTFTTSGWQDSNLRPYGSEPNALPTALHPVLYGDHLVVAEGARLRPIPRQRGRIRTCDTPGSKPGGLA